MNTGSNALPSTSESPVAPAWHTATVLGLLLVLATLGRAHLGIPLPGPYRRIGSYLISLGFEWGLVAFIAWGLGRDGRSLRQLIGRRASLKRLVVEFFCGVGFLIVANLILRLLMQLLHANAVAAARQLLPRTNAELAVFLLLSATAGFCEEVIFRGYLQAQFAAATASPAAGNLIQALLFGAAHAYQGSKMIVVIAVFGLLFGLLARAARGLRPGIMAHTLQDSLAGLVLARHWAVLFG